MKNKLKTSESSYGKTKQMGEKFYFAATKKLSMFVAFGAHPSAKLGKSGSNNLIPFVIQQQLEFKNFLFGGDDYPTVDGTAVKIIFMW